MKTKIPAFGKSLFLLLTTISLHIASSHAQQNIIINKDNTRPETREQINPERFASLQSSPLTVTKHNGYNEISWSSLSNDATNNFIVEYSFDGVNFSGSGPITSSNGAYNYKHYTPDTRPILYRLRIEDPSGKRYYSNSIMLDGKAIAAVQLYTNIVKGNMINATAQFPVEKVIISSSDGTALFTKDINGQRDFIPIAIPALARGIYIISFYGKGWQSSDKFIIG